MPIITLNAGHNGSGFVFQLENCSDHVAAKVNAKNVVIEIPEAILRERRELREHYLSKSGDTARPLEDTESEPWKIVFASVSTLSGKGSPGMIRPMPYSVEGVGGTRGNVLEYVLQNISTNFVSELFLVIEFSNVLDIKRLWHIHYAMRYDLLKERQIEGKYLGSGEVKNGRCSCC